MPGKMKSVCEGCGGEILFERDSTGREVIEANPDQYTNLCGTCRAKQGALTGNQVEESRSAADFEDERNKATRTGGTGNAPE